MVVHAIILAEDGKFRASLGYIDRPCQRKEIRKRERRKGWRGQGEEREEQRMGRHKRRSVGRRTLMTSALFSPHPFCAFMRITGPG